MAGSTAVIVPVPAAEPVVGVHRCALDRSAGWGVPAHVTVLFPFVPPEAVDVGVLAALAEAVGSVPAFDVTFARTDWFGDRVLWLAPEPVEPFRALTAAVWGRFPACPPYEGIHEATVPHLTIGHDAPVGALRAAADAVLALPPVRARVTSAWLWAGTPEPGGWHPTAEFPLGP